MRYAPVTETRTTIAVDIGGTTTRVALAVPSLKEDTPPALSSEGIIGTDPDYATQTALLHDIIAAQMQRAEQLHASARYALGGSRRVTGIGVSVGGRIAPDGSGVQIAPNLRDYERRPLVQDLSDQSGGLPVRIAHDAVCGLLAERRYGALRDATRCAYLTLSTGTGCAAHLGSPKGGPGVNISIEMGHQLLDGNQRLCLCGQVGCLETYTGGKQLSVRHNQPIETLSEEESAETWRDAVEKLSIGLVNLVHLTRVECVAVGGAIALNRPQMLVAVREKVTERLRGARFDLVPAALGESAPLIGAAMLLATPADELLH